MPSLFLASVKTLIDIPDLILPLGQAASCIGDTPEEGVEQRCTEVPFVSSKEPAVAYNCVSPFIITSKQTEEIGALWQLMTCLKLLSLRYHLEKDIDILS